MQGLDKYRGDGGGAVDSPQGSTGLSSMALNYVNILRSSAERTKLDPSDANYLSRDQFDLIYNSIPADIIAEINKARSQ
jgi:hypothetical protein